LLAIYKSMRDFNTWLEQEHQEVPSLIGTPFPPLHGRVEIQQDAKPMKFKPRYKNDVEFAKRLEIGPPYPRDSRTDKAKTPED